LTNISLYRVLLTLRPLLGTYRRTEEHGAAGPWQVVTHIAGSKRRSLLMAVDYDEMFMIRNFNVTPKKTEQHSVVVNLKPK